MGTSWTQSTSAAKFTKSQLQFKQSAGRMWIELWGRVEHSFKTASNILHDKKNYEKYLYISNSVFTMNSSSDKKIVFCYFLGEGSIYMWQKFQLCQSPYSCFLQKYHIFCITDMWTLFFWKNICSFTPVQIKIIIFGWKVRKIQPFTF